MECVEDFVQDLVRVVYGPGYQIAKKNGAARKSSFDERMEKIREIEEKWSIPECCSELDRLNMEIAVEKGRLEKRASEILGTLKKEEELCELAEYEVYEKNGVHLTSERLETLRREKEIVRAARTRLARKRLNELCGAELANDCEYGGFTGKDMVDGVKIIAAEKAAAPVSL